MEARRSPNFFYIKPEKARARSLKPEPDPSPKIVGPTQPYGESLHVCSDLFHSVPFQSILFRSAPFRLCTQWFLRTFPPSLPPSLPRGPFRSEVNLSVCVFWSVPFCSNFIPFPPSRSAPCRLCIYWVKLFHFISFSISPPPLPLRSVLFFAFRSVLFRSVLNHDLDHD
jgi:hypothetical protein